MSAAIIRQTAKEVKKEGTIESVSEGCAISVWQHAYLVPKTIRFVPVKGEDSYVERRDATILCVSLVMPEDMMHRRLTATPAFPGLLETIRPYWGVCLDADPALAINCTVLLTRQDCCRNGNTVRLRLEATRGLKTTDSAVIPGLRIFHNFIRPHQSLDDNTPADRAGIRVHGIDKWKTIIQNAAQPEDQTPYSDPVSWVFIAWQDNTHVLPLAGLAVGTTVAPATSPG